jgi:hypothetical protein
MIYTVSGMPNNVLTNVLGGRDRCRYSFAVPIFMV